jgi:hypothetical protein
MLYGTFPTAEGGEGGDERNARKGGRGGGLTEHNFAHPFSFFELDGVFQEERGWIGVTVTCTSLHSLFIPGGPFWPAAEISQMRSGTEIHPA